MVQILETVRDHPEVSSFDMAGHIIKAVEAFTGGTAAEDDRTVVVVRALGTMPEPLVHRSSRDLAFAQVA